MLSIGTVWYWYCLNEFLEFWIIKIFIRAMFYVADQNEFSAPVTSLLSVDQSVEFVFEDSL